MDVTSSPHTASYKMQLDDLNSLQPPSLMFKEIDSLIQRYHSLKRYG